MSKLKLIVFTFVSLMAVGVITAAVVAFGPRQPGNSLAQLALQPSDLPDSDWKVAEATDMDDLAQPLNRENAVNVAPTQSQVLISYQSAYKIETLVSDELFAAYVGNYLYRYNSPDEVEIATKVLQDAFAREGGDMIAAFTGTEQQELTGQAFSLRGSEGDAIYYFVGSQNDVLVILMVNGAPTPQTEAGFISLIEMLPNK